jgi:hypothetical protein
MLKTNKAIIGLLILLLAGVGYWFYMQSQKPKATEFAGSIEKIEGNIVYLSGTFVTDDPRIERTTRTIQVEVDDSTKFTRVVVEIPSRQEIEKAQGFIDAPKLPRVESSSSFSAMVSDNSDQNTYGGLSVYAKSGTNIFGKDKFVASEIKYVFGRQKQ